MRKKEVKKNRDYLKTILFSIRFSHAPRNIFSSKKSSQTHKNQLKTHIEALEIQIFYRGRPPDPPNERGSPTLVLSPLSCRRHQVISSAGPLLKTWRRPCQIVMSTKFYHSPQFSFTNVAYLVRVAKCTQPTDWFLAFIQYDLREQSHLLVCS